MVQAAMAPKGCLIAVLCSTNTNFTATTANITSRNAYNLHVRWVARKTPLSNDQHPSVCDLARPTLCDLPVAHCTEILIGQNTEFTYKLGTLTEGISSFKKMSHLNTIRNTQNDALSVFIDTSMRQAVTLPTVHTQHQTVLCTKMMPPSFEVSWKSINTTDTMKVAIHQILTTNKVWQCTKIFPDMKTEIHQGNWW